MKLVASLVLILFCALPAVASTSTQNATAETITENCDAMNLQQEVSRNTETLLAVVEQQANLVAQLEQNHLLLEKLMLEMNTKTNVYDKETLRTILEDIRYSTDKISQR